MSFKNFLNRFKLESKENIIQAIIALRSKMYAIKYLSEKTPSIKRKHKTGANQTANVKKKPRLEACKLKVYI